MVVDNIGLIKISGKDAVKFLQGQLTCDVDNITEDHPCMGAHCNREGRVIAVFYLFKHQDAYYLLLQSEMISILLAALKKYSIFFKVEMTETNDSTLPLDEWKKIMTEAGTPPIYPETSGKFLPHELNLDLLNALNFNKGCYTGQEIIARMHYRGKLKTRMFKAEVSAEFEPKPGEDIYTSQNNEWKSSGSVVSAAKVYNNTYELLIIANENDKDLYLSKDMKSVLTLHK